MFINKDLTIEQLREWREHHNNTYPFKHINTYVDLCRYYRPSIKKETVILALILEKNNINLYEQSLHWYKSLDPQHYYTFDNKNIFELINYGLNKGKIDLNNESNYVQLKKIFCEKLKSPSKIINKNKFSLLNHLIKTDKENIKYLYDFILACNEKYPMDVKERISLKEYVLSLPKEEVNKYSELSQFWSNLDNKETLEERESYNYNVLINSLIISKNKKILLKEVQQQLLENIENFSTILMHKKISEIEPIIQSLKNLRRINKVSYASDGTNIELDYLSDNLEDHNHNKLLISSVLNEFILNPKQKYSLDEIEKLLESQDFYLKLENKVNNIESKDIKKSKKKI